MINIIKLLWRLLRLFRPCWGWMLLGILLSLITIIANVGLLALSGWFIAIMGMAGVAGITQINYFTPAAMIRGLAIARTAGRYAERLISHEATLRLLSRFRTWFYEHLEPLAPAVLQGYHSGDLLSRIRADIDHLENFYLRIFSPLIVASLAIILYSLFLHRYNSQLSITITVLLIFTGFLLPLSISKTLKQSGIRIITTKTELRMAVIDTVQGMGEIVINNTEDDQRDKVSHLSQHLDQDQLRQIKINGFSQAMTGLSANLAMWFILLITIPLVNQQQLQPEMIPMLALFALASFEAIFPLPLAFQMLPETITSARRIFELVDIKPLITEPQQASPVPESMDIEFDQVSFHYTDNEIQILDKLSFLLPAGKRLAIVGKSGTGKTTIINLLLRFWPVTEGRISLGGYPLDQFNSDDIRRYISVAPQQSSLFNSTIRRNLLLANPQATEIEIEQVCHVAQIHEFIISQPDGYDTWIGEAGLKLSGGQGRRIAIARALLKHAPILILDEPGEGLDIQTEQTMIKAILDYKSESSILLITHRKTGLDKMDSVINLNSL